MRQSGTAGDSLITEKDWDKHFKSTSVRGAVDMANLKIWLTPLIEGMTLEDLHSSQRNRRMGEPDHQGSLGR